MLCLACTLPSGGPLCERCRLELRGAPEVTVADGVTGMAGYVHEGPARALVHALKYRGVIAAAGPLAEAMADRVPAGITALVPVPRARIRVLRYGIDPAAVLARAVSERTGIPVVDGLAPRWWWRRHAGRNRGERGAVRFAPSPATVPPGCALVDDVLTTGATMRSAAGTLGGLPTLALTGTIASRVKRGDGPPGGAVTVQPSSGPNERISLRARTTHPDGVPPRGGNGRSHDRHGEEQV